MRKWCARIAGFLAVVSACLAAPSMEPKPETEKFEKILSKAAFEPTKVSMPEVVDAMKGMLRAKKENFGIAFPAFKMACSRADALWLPELVGIFRLVPADDIRKGDFFLPLGQAWLRVKVPGELAKPLKFPAVESEINIPKGFPKAAALRRYLAVREPMRRFIESHPKGEGRSVQIHEAEYWQLVESLLGSDTGPFAERLGQYHWGGWGCGTGSEIFMIPQATALAMAFVADGKWEEAAGAALLARGVDVGGSERLLRVCVGDSQAVVLGGLARLDLDPESYFFAQTPLLAMVLDMPGNSRARGLMDLAVRAPGDNQANYFRALAMLARDDAGDEYARIAYSIFSGEDLSAAKVQPVDKETQAKVKAFLCTQDVSHLSIAAAEELVRILADSEWPEAIPALRSLLEHPSLTVAESAAKRLKEAGETVQIPPKLGPVRYRLLVDGKPYASKRVAWYINWAALGRGEEVMSDADGVVEVPRDHFIDNAAGQIRGFGLHSQDLEDVSSPWFGVRLPLPPANDDIIPVEVKTTPVRIRLPEVRPQEELDGKFITVKVNPVTWPGESSLGFSQSARVGVPAAGEFTLSLAPGEYGLEVRAPGASTWIGKVRAGKDAELSLPLVRASTVRYSYKLPEGWPQYAGQPLLMQDGKVVMSDHDAEKRMYRGVSEGKYVLHFRSSAEVRQRHEFWKDLKAPDFEGVDVPVEVTDDSPVVIDVGAVELK
jgi:hypothetical protein